MTMLVILSAVLLPGCAKRQNLGTVAVDLYLHPESAKPEDVLLATAIRARLEKDPLTMGRVYARVTDGEAVLTGNVASDAALKHASQIAGETTVEVTGLQQLRAAKVTLHVTVGNQ